MCNAGDISNIFRQMELHDLVTMNSSEFTHQLNRSPEKLKDLISNYQEDLAKVRLSDEEYTEAEIKLLELIVVRYPVMSTLWNHHALLDEYRYLQNDFIIDLESVNYRNPPHVLNEEAMKMGVAPVGPDNQSIRVCTLTNNVLSSRIEIVADMVTTVEQFLYPYGKQSLHCLGERELKDYWKSRVYEFVRDDGSYRRRYLESHHD